MTTTSRFTLPHTGGEASLAYELRGGGVPVVQLHGLNSSRGREIERGRDLTAEQRGLRVLRYDARGHGESTGWGSRWGRPPCSRRRWPSPRGSAR